MWQETQFISATHSPILLAHPDAAFMVFKSATIKENPYDAVETVALTRQFLTNPTAYMRRHAAGWSAGCMCAHLVESNERWGRRIIAMPAASINVRVTDEARLRQLDALAEATGRSRALLVNEALERYLDEESWQLARIEEGLKQADAGEFSTSEEVTASVRAVIAVALERKATRDGQKATA